MGRHGGGSRSDGSRRSSSRSGGLRSSRTSVSRNSTQSFSGCYNRSYYYKGNYYPYYTTDPSFGVKKSFTVTKTVFTIIITVQFLAMITSMTIFSGSSIISIGGKVDGNPQRIKIIDEIDLLTPSEEEKTLSLLHQVYEKSGMPVTIITDDFEWKQNYSDIQIYSEELYYAMGMEETAMVILFTREDIGSFTDWEFDIYCGDDTVRCLSDDTFDPLVSSFYKSMANQDLYYALDYSWNTIMEELAKKTFPSFLLYIILFYAVILFIIFKISFSINKKRKHAEKYFHEHPEMLNNQPMTLYSECPGCGAQNTTMSETCSYCGSVLKLTDGNITFVKP